MVKFIKNPLKTRKPKFGQSLGIQENVVQYDIVRMSSRTPQISRMSSQTPQISRMTSRTPQISRMS